MRTNPLPVIVLAVQIKLSEEQIQFFNNIGIYQIFELPEKAHQISQEQTSSIHGLVKVVTNAAYARISDQQDLFYKK